MNAFEKLSSLAELDESICELNHGSDEIDKQAINYVVIPLGKVKDGIEEVKDELVIPVCQECQDSFQSDKWTLLYCLECNNNQWILQDTSKLSYKQLSTNHHYHIILMVGCPHCSKKLKALYFPDIEMWK